MNLDETQEADICRVCRSEGSPDKPLFHPCICMGSIKYIHQDCLLQWLKFSKKDVCELCHHKFSFSPIYSADMPTRLPIKDLLYGLLINVAIAFKCWIHYSIAAICWLILVPAVSYRIIKCLFNGSFYSFFTAPFDIFTFENLITEKVYGAISVLITILCVTVIIWLREVIVREIPDWLENDNAVAPVREAEQVEQVEQLQQPRPENEGQNNGERIQEGDQVDAVEQEQNNENNIVNPDDLVDHPAAAAAAAVAAVEQPDQAVVEQHVNNDLVVVQDEADWNQNEWDRQNEDISFERIFGLDGSLMFVEHIFWVISINSFFVFAFAFCPYHIGLYYLSKFDLFFDFNEQIEIEKFEKVLVTFIGYLIIGMSLVLLHYLLFKFARIRRILGICYLIIKVAIVTVLEIGVLPIMCGCLLDLFSLPLFGSTFHDRELYFKTSPGLSIFIHWCLGFTYIYYITSFLIVLKDILKPSLLSFIETLNNPDFSPVHEIIHLSVFQIVRRYIIYSFVFILLTFILVFLPAKTVESLFVDFLPYNLFSNYENNAKENGALSIELWRLHIIAPLICDYSSLKICIKSSVNYLCLFFAYLLDLKSFLLRPDEEEEEEEEVVEEEQEEENEDAEADNDAMADNENEANHRDEENQENEFSSLLSDNVESIIVSRQKKLPDYLYLRLFALSNLVCGAIFLFGIIVITVPILIGRRAIGLFVSEQVSELYTVTCGLYIIILTTKVVNLLIKWVPKGRQEILNKLTDVLLMFIKTVSAAVLLCGFLPLLVGFPTEVMILVPLRVASNQTPIYYLIQDWLLGIFLIKLIVLMALFGDWNLRESLEEFYQAGFVNIDLKKIVAKFILPVFFTVGLILSVPYVFVHGLLSYLGFSYESLDVILRKIYLFTWCLVAVVYLLQWQFFRFCKLYEHIKNEKYLVGRKLINFEGNRKQQEPVKRSLLAIES